MTTKKPNEKLVGERVTLKRYDDSTAEKINKIVVRNREFLSKFFEWAKKETSLEDEKKLFQDAIQNWNDNKSFGYEINANNNIIGILSANAIDTNNHSTDLGFWMIEDAQGNGYMTESIKLLENELFNGGFNRITMEIFSSNARSLDVAKRNGYKLDGILRQAIFEHEKYKDLHVYSKLKSEYTVF